MARPSPLYCPSRRALITRSAAIGASGLGLAGLAPRAARGSSSSASISASDRKFIFVFAIGGWDPTRVFADGFDNDLVDMEPTASRANNGDLNWISHPDRPEVDSFFDRYASKTAFLQGMLIPSIAHEACFVLALTGRPTDTGSDWPSLLGLAAKDRYIAPNLVIGGPSFPGTSRQAVVQSGSTGQLADLLSGGYRGWSAESNGVSLALGSRQKLDAWVTRRANAYLASAPSGAAASALAFQNAIAQGRGLEAESRELNFAAINSLGDALTVAHDAVTTGVSRCVMTCDPVSGERGYDSHTTNDDLQNVLFGNLFGYLESLIFSLDSQPGIAAPTMLEETTVVVFSEMGRTPWLNSASGKDHWPYTSVMLIGSGIRGGVSIGGWDEAWVGQPIDLDSGDVSEAGESFTSQHLGATLLALGDVDWREHCPEASPINAIMSDAE